MTRFWWVRHGPTHETAFTGWRDVPADLSDTARLDRLNAALPHAPVIASDLIRASATAGALTARRPRPPHPPPPPQPHLGDRAGNPSSELAPTPPGLSRLYWEAPGDHAPPNGESWNQASTRICGEVDSLLATHQGGDLILVAHFGAILTQLARARGFDVARAFARALYGAARLLP